MLSKKAVNKVIFHVDIDAFYASVEQKDNPDLRGKPVIVGAAPGHRGVVSACSYEARQYGIHSAMPVSEAYRKCPHGIFLPVRMGRYIQASKRVMSILGSYSPIFHQISVDEAFLDLTGTERLFGSPRSVGRRMKDEVKSREQLVISIGIASNAYLAKLASEAGKPDGLFLVEEGRESEFLDGLELGRLWGVGGKTLSRLQELNIRTVPQLRSFSEGLLKPMLGEGAARFLYRAVRGMDPGIYPSEPKSHSLSNEVTFERDRRDSEILKRVLLELSQQVMDRLLQDNLRSKTVSIKVRFHDFTTTNAQKTVKHWLTSSTELYSLALDLLKRRWDGHTPIRLIGLGVSGVVKDNEPDQLELFQDPDSRKKKVEQAVIGIKKRWSDVKLTRASLLEQSEIRHPGQIKGGPAGTKPASHRETDSWPVQ